jgi:MoaA/NifB/PqqE/SkfB family radical SAM enzyme
MQFLDIDLHGLVVTMCGNYGDPIYHPDLLELIKAFKSQGAVLDIITNGSYRKQSWWQELTNELSSDDSVTFSIDGIPENFTQYRVNGDWETIHDAINVCVESSCKTIWKFIPFSYNENNIQQARQLSMDLGMDQFKVDFSDRFDEVTMHFKPNEDKIAARWNNQQNWKQSIATQQLVPECQNGKMHYVSADGYYMPCCYTGDHRFYYKNEFGKNKRQYAIKDNTLSEILKKSVVGEFYDKLTDHTVCQYNCGE